MNEETSSKTTSEKSVGFKPLNRKKLDITKKEIIRNCSVSVSSKTDSQSEVSSKKVISGGNKKEDNKFDFSAPALHSSLKIAKNIQDIKNSKPSSAKSSVKECKPVKKVNIPFHEKVYKDLIELRVSEETLGIMPGVRPRELTSSRDPEPCLSDFYKPSFDKEYTVKFLPEGIKVEKEWFYDGYTVSRAIGLLDPEQDF